MLGTFKVDAAASAAIAATRPAARDVFFTAKGHTPVAAMAAHNMNLGFVNEHRRTGVRD